LRNSSTRTPRSTPSPSVIDRTPANCESKPQRSATSRRESVLPYNSTMPLKQAPGHGVPSFTANSFEISRRTLLAALRPANLVTGWRKIGAEVNIIFDHETSKARREALNILSRGIARSTPPATKVSRCFMMFSGLFCDQKWSIVTTRTGLAARCGLRF